MPPGAHRRRSLLLRLRASAPFHGRASHDQFPRMQGRHRRWQLAPRDARPDAPPTIQVGTSSCLCLVHSYGLLWQHGVHAAIVAMVTTTRRVPIKRAQVSPTQMVGLSTVISVGVVVTIQAVTVEHGLRHTIVHQASNTWTACVREFSLAGAPQSQVQGALVNANT